MRGNAFANRSQRATLHFMDSAAVLHHEADGLARVQSLALHLVAPRDAPLPRQADDEGPPRVDGDLVDPFVGGHGLVREVHLADAVPCLDFSAAAPEALPTGDAE